jgi:hypothetical protein
MRPGLHIKLVLLTVTVAGSVRAQSSVGIAVGPSIPTGTVGSEYAMGYHIVAMAQTLPPDRALGFRFEASYDAFARQGTIQHITQRVIAGSANAVARPLGATTTVPYLIGGFGMYNQGTNPAPATSSPATEIGYNFGGGVRFALKNINAYAEARYHQVLLEGGARFVPVTVGIVF